MLVWPNSKSGQSVVSRGYHLQRRQLAEEHGRSKGHVFSQKKFGIVLWKLKVPFKCLLFL